jgi:alkylation response protein AidB-like acyl-CoA dehydrogenase
MILTDVQSAIQDSVRTWAQDRVRPNARLWEAEGAYPPIVLEELASLGLMGMTARPTAGRRRITSPMRWR